MASTDGGFKVFCGVRIFYDSRPATPVDPSKDDFIKWLEYEMWEIGGKEGRPEEDVDGVEKERTHCLWEKALRTIPATSTEARELS
ncbi:hypothetical protein V5O48_006494 [Marasmius crinis-equi]|uniref:Uncharacterized protein n=1 Tax=Marasmius crinis-equi TaxID=585013 RepID=A0ABR3FJX7_9AGAR